MNSQEKALYMKEYRKANRVKLRQQEGEWVLNNPEARSQHNAKHYYKNKEIIHEKQAEYRRLYREQIRERARGKYPEYKEKYRDRILARSKLNHAIASGAIIRPDICGECSLVSRIEGHHFDYTKALEVMWLCKDCHMKLHRKPQLRQEIRDRIKGESV